MPLILPHKTIIPLSNYPPPPLPPTIEVLIQKKKGVCRPPKKEKYRWRKMGKGRGGEEKEGAGGGGGGGGCGVGKHDFTWR